MAGFRKTKPGDLASANAFLSVLLPTPPGVRELAHPYEKMAGWQGQHLAEDTPKLIADLAAKGWELPAFWERLEINTRRISNANVNIPKHARAMDLGSRLRAFAPGVDADLDIMPVLDYILRDIRKHSPVYEGHYRKNFEVWLGGRRVQPSMKNPSVDENLVGLIMNRSDHASTLETADYAKAGRGKGRPFTRRFRHYVNRFGKDWDVSMQFIDPSPFGGMIYTSTYRAGYRPVYAVPVILVGYLNAFGRDSFGRQRAGVLYTKGRRRTLSGKYNVRNNPAAISKRKKLKLR